MSASAAMLSLVTAVCLPLLALAMVLTVWRVLRGPSLADRVLALDMMTAIAIGFMAVFAVRTRHALYIDIAIALGLVGFLATVAFARFILTRPARKAPAPPPARPRPPRANDRRTRR